MKRPGIIRRAISASLGAMQGWLGAYNSTDPRRKIIELFRVQRATANQALSYNLPTLVNQSRQLERNCPNARAIGEGWKADVIGTGIDVQPDTGRETLDDAIRELWLEWAEHAGVDGSSLWELQSQSCAEVVTAGALLWRWVILPERLKDGLLPLAIMPLEPEWLSSTPVAPIAKDARFVQGKEVDKYGRPIAYHIADPERWASGVVASDGFGVGGERVPAAEITHGFEKRRPGQVHGEPVLSVLIEVLKQSDDLPRIELKSAEIASNVAIAITSKYHANMAAADEDSDDDEDDPTVDMPPGSVTRLYPEEDIKVIQSNRPNQMIMPFLAGLRGYIAAGARVAQKWLNRDYSSSTFMNTRMEQADSKRMHKPTQNWIARHVASEPYRRVLPYILLRLGVEMPTNPIARKAITAHTVMPDMPEYVDPLKDGAAALQNIAGKLSTRQEECSSRGKDWQKIDKQIAKEQAATDAANVARIAALQIEIDKAKALNPNLSLEWSMLVTLGGAETAPGAYLQAAATQAIADSRTDSTDQTEQLKQVSDD